MAKFGTPSPARYKSELTSYGFGIKSMPFDPTTVWQILSKAHLTKPFRSTDCIMNLRGVVLLVAVLAAVAAAIPVPSFRWRRNPKPRLVAPKPIGKRWQDGVDCTTDTAGTKNTPGLMFAVGSDGENLPCDQLDAASTSS